MTLAGRVAELYRFPVKSMAGEPLTSADVSWNGLAGDRRWAFIRAGRESSGSADNKLRIIFEYNHQFPDRGVRGIFAGAASESLEHKAGAGLSAEHSRLSAMRDADSNGG